MHRLILAALTALALTACKRESNPAALQPPTPDNTEAPTILATFYVPAYLTQRLTENAANIITPIPPTEDPAFWDPTADIITRFQRAPLVVANGAGYERWVDRSPLPESRLVRSADALRANWIQLESTTHSHGPAGEHTHSGPDGHTWLDPNNAATQAAAIAQALTAAFPNLEPTVTTNLEQLTQDLAALDRAFTDTAARLQNTRLLAAHPSFNYPARRYAWNLDNLDNPPDPNATDPTPIIADIQRAAAEAAPQAPNAERIIILWTTPPNPDLADAIRSATGATSVHFDTAERPPQTPDAPDYLQRMRHNLDRLNAATNQP